MVLFVNIDVIKALSKNNELTVWQQVEKSRKNRYFSRNCMQEVEKIMLYIIK